MNNDKFINLLRAVEACDDAVEWCQIHGGTLAELWNDCERGDWMWWLLTKTDVPRKEQSVKFTRWCAKRVAYATYADAYAADAADAYADAYVAYAASAAADWAADAAARAAAWAAAAARAAAAAAANAYAAAAYVAERKAQAEYIRKNFNCPKIK